MPSVKVKFYKSKRYADGTIPVAIRAISGGTKLRVLFSIPEEDWDEEKLQVKKNAKLSSRYNQIINKELSESRERMLTAMASGRNITPEEILGLLGTHKISDAFDRYLETVPNHATKRRYINVRDKVHKYFPDATLELVNENWMKKFHSKLTEDPKLKSPGTIYRYIKFLKTVLRSEAIEERFFNLKALTYSAKSYESPPVVLSKAEMKKISEVELPDEVVKVVRDAFILMFYLWGIRVGDMLQLRRSVNLSGNTINYNMRKNQDTGRRFSIELEPKAIALIEKYSNDSDYIIPLLKNPWRDPRKDVAFHKHIQAYTSVMNKGMKVIAKMAGIDKNITNHVARHTFAAICDEKKLSLTEIQHLLGHSKPSQTDTYLKKIRKAVALNESASRVFDGIDF